ncbi:Histone deacetylase complex subunit sap18 [Cichlidogyrus casuarinus]|uniref:18 kDa Sin3-associated polypeptide n=1 Tax=Cichlidogyrus casuarinus TaxID=1844966 RepID=A0ABD2QJQ0_9PLAT
MVKLVMKSTDIQKERMKTCPFLIKLIIKEGAHHNPSEFSNGNFPNDELRVHTWMNATLAELTSLIQHIYPKYSVKNTSFSFCVVYPDPKTPAYRMKEIGTVVTGLNCDTNKIQLSDCAFRIGDYIDVSINTPSKNGSITARTNTAVRSRLGDVQSADRPLIYNRLSKRSNFRA